MNSWIDKGLVMAKKKKVELAELDPKLVMAPPRSGVRIRMYRQGHGDCFLLAFKQEDGSPFYMLIDCGMKPGSRLLEGPDLPNGGVSMAEVVADIRQATAAHLNLVVITHEHEDHVNGFRSEKATFQGIEIDKLWLAWTEKPDFKPADDLREEHTDVLLGLLATADRLQSMGARASGADQRTLRNLRNLLEFEVGDLPGVLAAAGPKRIEGITVKEGMLVVKELANKNEGIDYLFPHSAPKTFPQIPGLRTFVLGPPEDPDLLEEEEFVGDESYFAAASRRAQGASFFAAVGDGANDSAAAELHQPFDPRHRIPTAELEGENKEFFEAHYGWNKARDDNGEHKWRSIDTDWLRTGEQLALRLNKGINNTSIVLAFELPKSKRVVLFVADAQRGNWISWAKKFWDSSSGLDDGEKITSRDLLNRTVFYKVGHHGSHNATLKTGGFEEMAKGKLADELVCMIPAYEKWALGIKWVHPFPPILRALQKKARGRVFRLDKILTKPAALSSAEWEAFSDRCKQSALYMEYVVDDPG
jgi:beta-lactamase superfamily II metal-dependent hydrolase